MTSAILLGLLAYILGSIPSSVWIGKWFYGKDVRQHGSGNAGATNTFRVLGKRPGIAVLLLDIAKGFVAVNLVRFAELTAIELPMLFGIAAILGHTFSVFLNFKGGKGVATSLAVALAIAPISVGIALVVFLATLALSRMVSLSSILAALIFAIAVSTVFETTIGIRIFAWVIAFFILYTHRGNIDRIRKGTESKI